VPLSMQEFFAGGARGLVGAQLALDDAGRDAIDGWDETGVLPSVFTWATCRLRLPVSFALDAKENAGGSTQALVEPALGGAGSIELGFRYLPTPQE
jgi:hypothetical protein